MLLSYSGSSCQRFPCRLPRYMVHPMFNGPSNNWCTIVLYKSVSSFGDNEYVPMPPVSKSDESWHGVIGTNRALTWMGNNTVFWLKWVLILFLFISPNLYSKLISKSLDCLMCIALKALFWVLLCVGHDSTNIYISWDINQSYKRNVLVISI